MVKQRRPIADGTQAMRAAGIASVGHERLHRNQTYTVSYLRADVWIRVGEFTAVSQIKAIAQFSKFASSTFECDAVKAVLCA